MKTLLILVACLTLTGCYASMAKSQCESLGYTGAKQAVCAEKLLNSYLQGRRNSARNYSTGYSHNVSHQHQQVLRHGAGGCTPNFATGGCL